MIWQAYKQFCINLICYTSEDPNTISQTDNMLQSIGKN